MYSRQVTQLCFKFLYSIKHACSLRKGGAIAPFAPLWIRHCIDGNMPIKALIAKWLQTNDHVGGLRYVPISVIVRDRHIKFEQCY